MKQLQQKQQKLQLRENMKKPNNWRKNHLTLLFGFTNNLTPAPIQWHTNTREATGRLRAKETFMMSPTSFNCFCTIDVDNMEFVYCKFMIKPFLVNYLLSDLH